jgi:uncharacterized membrane protein
MVVKTLIKRGLKQAKKVKPKRPRGTPTKAAMMARRSMLKGETKGERVDITKKYEKEIAHLQKKLDQFRRRRTIAKGSAGLIGGAAAAGTAYGISKNDKFKKTTKKLKEATDKIRAKDKEKKEKRKDNQRQK